MQKYEKNEKNKIFNKQVTPIVKSQKMTKI